MYLAVLCGWVHTSFLPVFALLIWVVSKWTGLQDHELFCGSGRQLNPDLLFPRHEAPPGGWWPLSAPLSPLVGSLRAGPVICHASCERTGSTVDRCLHRDPSHLAWRHSFQWCDTYLRLGDVGKQMRQCEWCLSQSPGPPGAQLSFSPLRGPSFHSLRCGGVIPPSAGSSWLGNNTPPSPTRPDADSASGLHTNPIQPPWCRSRSAHLSEGGFSGPEKQSLKCSRWSQPSFQKAPTQARLYFLMGCWLSLVGLPLSPVAFCPAVGSAFKDWKLLVKTTPNPTQPLPTCEPRWGWGGHCLWTSGAKSLWATPWSLPLRTHEPSAPSWSPTH